MKIQKNTAARKMIAARLRDYLKFPSQFRCGAVCGAVQMLSGDEVSIRQKCRIIENVVGFSIY